MIEKPDWHKSKNQASIIPVPEVLMEDSQEYKDGNDNFELHEKIGVKREGIDRVADSFGAIHELINGILART